MIKYTILITEQNGKKTLKCSETFAGARTVILFADKRAAASCAVFRGISDRAQIPEWEYNELTKGTKFQEVEK